MADKKRNLQNTSDIEKKRRKEDERSEIEDVGGADRLNVEKHRKRLRGRKETGRGRAKRGKDE